MVLNRRQWLTSITAGLGAGAAGSARGIEQAQAQSPARLRAPDGSVDWAAVRALFPLAPDWVHLAGFLLVSHPRPVAEAIEHFRRKLDADPVWLELAALSDSEGRPFRAIKSALAEYLGGRPDEISYALNTTCALAMAYHGLRIRPDQEILTTEHDHYSHHESIRYAAERSGCGVRYQALYEQGSRAGAQEMVARLERAIRPNTRAVGVTWVHSSTGVKIPLQPIAEAVARANRGRPQADRCLLIVDGVHGLGNQDVDIGRIGCDFFAAGTHKWLLAPRGTGFLWGRKDVWPELRPTIPSFDPDVQATWQAWMNRAPLPPTQAAFVSTGGFLAFEHFLAIPAALQLHRSLGRDRIATRISELNRAFREAAASMPRVRLHTPRDPELSAGISCFEVSGLSAAAVTSRLAAKKIRTNPSPYRASYARVAAGVMNSIEDVETAVREIRRMAS
jgi:selenocysteine lyase/cysteine desulfurase